MTTHLEKQREKDNYFYTLISKAVVQRGQIQLEPLFVDFQSYLHKLGSFNTGDQRSGGQLMVVC